MKMGLKNRLRLISLVPLIVLISVASYFVYSSYQNLNDADKLKEKLVENKYLSAILTSVARERGMSAMYIGKPSQTVFESLKKQRKITDKAIDDFFISISKKPDLQKTSVTLSKSFSSFIKIL